MPTTTSLHSPQRQAADEATGQAPPTCRRSRAPACSDTDSESDAGAAPPFVRDQEFWLDDGTIILVARDIGFRVYRGLLAAQSPIFQDTFSCATPSKSAGESFGGCPVVHLTDSPEDLRHLFSVLLPVTKRTFDCGALPRKDTVTTFDRLSSVIRLAHKYNIVDVKEQALDVLKTWYPSDFDAFGAWSETPYEEGRSVADAIGAINIARLTDTPEILPFAFMLCFDMGGDILDGRRREDGTVEHLDSADLRRCLKARTPLSKEANDMRVNLLEKGINIECSGSRCKDGIRTVFTSTSFKTGGGPDGVLDDWGSSVVEHFRVSRIRCSGCMAGLLALEKEERRRIWNMLPTIFDVQGNELGGEESDDEAVGPQTGV